MKTETPPNHQGLPGAQVATALGYVNYQDGSISKREVVRTSVGSVTILAFDEGQKLSEHKAPVDALVHVLAGEVEISVEGVPHRLHGGEMILIPARQPHALTAISGFKMILTKFRSET